MIVNAQGLKEAKTKQIGIKLLFQIIRKWGILKTFFLLKSSCKIILFFRMPSVRRT